MGSSANLGPRTLSEALANYGVKDDDLSGEDEKEREEYEKQRAKLATWKVIVSLCTDFSLYYIHDKIPPHVVRLLSVSPLCS